MTEDVPKPFAILLTDGTREYKAYFRHKDIPHYVAGSHTQRPAYRWISSFYEGKVAERSGVPYINHIDEGLGILNEIGATQNAMDAYCLHPLFQMNPDLLENHDRFPEGIDNETVVAAMEYRHIANSYLSDLPISSVADIFLSPLQDVNDMLIADKVQNYKDFLLYHDGDHPRSDLLNEYFNNWFERLGVDYDDLVPVIQPFDGDWW